MRLREPFAWPEDRAQQLRKAERLEWATILLMATVVAVMGATMGSSQAMRAAWIEDVLGLVPATIFLVARRFERRPPNERFPFGTYKVIPIAYLVSATTILTLALYMIYDSVHSLITRDHPTIGPIDLLGYDIWMGWLMIAALTYSVIPPMVLGRLKMPVAVAIHDKVLVADAAMQRADWTTGLAGIAGIIGVGFGFWWADSVAALAISANVLKDGGKHVVRALKDLADEIPTTPRGHDPDPLIEEVRRAVEALPWVKEVELALRDEGHPVSGVIYVRSRDGDENLTERLREAAEVAMKAHWRLYDPAVMPLSAKAGGNDALRSGSGEPR